MEFKATDVNAEKKFDNLCGKPKENEEMIINNGKVTVCRTTSCQSVSDCSHRNEKNAKTEDAADLKSDRPKMRIWGMLFPEDEEDGFELFLDSECYVLMLYREDKLMALFDPYDYTLPELNEILKNVMQAIRQNPLVMCTNRIFWSQN